MSVYHGSEHNFDIGKPSYTKRVGNVNGKRVVNYEGKSFHATPHKWIALSYIFEKNPIFIHKGEKEYFSRTVSLFNNNHLLLIFGKKSLEYLP